MMSKIDLIRTFYRGNFYPVFVAALAFVGHATGWDVPFACAVMLTAIPGMFIMHEANFMAAPFLMLTFTVSARYYDFSTADYHYERFLEKPRLILFLSSVAIVVVSLICFMVRNRRNANRLKQHSIFVGLLILCGVMLFNGIFNPVYTPKNVVFVFVFALSTIFLYFLFAFYGRFDDSSLDRFFFCLVVEGILILAQLALAYMTRVRFADGTIVKESVVVGWGVWTSVGGMLAFLMPAPFYFARWHRNGWVFYLIGLAMFAGTLFSQSRGALLLGGLILAVCLVFVCSGGANRKRNRIFTALVVALGIVGAVLLSRRLGILIRNFLDYGFGDNGRFALWEMGWKRFLKYPVFGSGFYGSFDGDWNFVVSPYLAHNTLVQMLGACGAAGLLAYLWHRALTVRLVLRNPNVRKSFLGVCLLGLLLFSLIDVLFFKTYATIAYTLILVHIEMSDGKEA